MKTIRSADMQFRDRAFGAAPLLVQPRHILFLPEWAVP